MTRRVKSLAVEAKQELSICCQTLCDRQLVEKYIQQLEDRVQSLEETLATRLEDKERYE
jgi:hypothetical protein|tara:strand:- start:925 stop:1101 length:177 start_codon:yes stop_codon:yes gene_type:complete